MHGEWWIEHHLRYIRRLWHAYPTRQKVHFSALYGCHGSFWRGGKNSVTCGSNDRPLARFLARQDSAEDFFSIERFAFHTAMGLIFIPAYCFALP